MNYEMALQRVGGFGFFQGFSVVSLSLLRNSGNWLLYLFAYLNLPQKYECRQDKLGDNWLSCSAKEDICPALEQGDTIEYRVDTSYEYYMRNW